MTGKWVGLEYFEKDTSPSTSGNITSHFASITARSACHLQDFRE